MVRLLDAIAGGGKGAEHFRTAARSHLERRGVKAVAGHMELADRPEAQRKCCRLTNEPTTSNATASIAHATIR